MQTCKIESKSATRHILDYARFSTSWKQARWKGYQLPAQGQELKSCHKWGMKGCLNHHEHPNNRVYVQSYLKECARSSCPLCVESWTNRIANRLTRRIEAWCKITNRRASHVVISIPGVVFDDVPKLKKLVKKIKSQVGITGSADVLHPFRFQKDGKLTPRVDPHLHLIAFGWIDGDEVKKVYEEHGIIVKKICTIEAKKIFQVCKSM